MKDKVIILFTRIPVPGKTKTRLEPFLDPFLCAQLQVAFIKDIYESIKDMGIDIIINYCGEGNLKMLKDILGEDLLFLNQEGKTLGDKMSHGLSFSLKTYNKAVLIGSDLPLISRKDIEIAFNVLEKKDTVIAPTYDGGYYLIGMKEENREIFHIKYSTDRVFEETVEKIRSTGKTFGLGSVQLDIDDKEDLLKLYKLLEEDDKLSCINTREFIEKIMKKRGVYEYC